MLTNGTVREARGLTSSTYTTRSLMANWMFISPTTPSSSAIARVCSRIASSSRPLTDQGGSEQAESPEWMPASSMCSMIPPITTVVPSEMASTSISMASSRNLSTRIGWSGEACTARSM